jgi:glyoxylase-like metal-dependent hydrolase (beta-lactamase superfamily II)
MSMKQLEPVILFDANMFIVKGDRPILVDCGTGFKVDKNIAAILDILDGRKLQAIVLTHRHFDHVGGAAAISQATGATLYAGEEDAVPLRAGDSKSTLGTDFGGSIPPMDVKGLKDGDVLDTGSHTLEVIATPGHTIGSISLYERATKTIICGDTLFVNGVGRYDVPTSSREDLVESLRRLHALQAEHMYPGHGPAFHGKVSEQTSIGLMMLGERP